MKSSHPKIPAKFLTQKIPELKISKTQKDIRSSPSLEIWSTPWDEKKKKVWSFYLAINLLI